MTSRPASHRYANTEPVGSHTAHVIREIGTGIVSGRYPQDSILPGDADLMQQFGVSRTVLREALKTLAGKGLIQARARVGTRVRDRAAWNLFDRDVLIWYATIGFDHDFLEHVTEMRRALEPEAAALAAVRRTPEQLERILHWTAQMRAAEKTTIADFVDADLHFHLAITEAAANPFLRSISTLIEVALVRVLTVSSPESDPARFRLSVRSHEAISDAILRQDPEASRAAMREVIEQGMDAIHKYDLHSRSAMRRRRSPRN